MYKFIKTRHDIIKQCHGNYKEMKKFNYKLETGIFRNSTQKYLGVLSGAFKGLGVQKDTQTTCWLRPCGMASHSAVWCSSDCKAGPILPVVTSDRAGMLLPAKSRFDFTGCATIFWHWR